MWNTHKYIDLVVIRVSVRAIGPGLSVKFMDGF